jgi:polysaccharide biosynthesis transport protein
VIPQDASFPDPAKNPPPSRRPAQPVAGRIEPRRSSVSDLHTAAAPAALSSSPEMSSYLQALRRRWIAAASLGGTLAILAALASWFLLSPKYIAFGRVRVAYELPSFHDQAGGGRGDFLTYLKTQATYLTTRPVISAALKRDEIKRLNLEAMTGEDPAQYIEKELKVEFQDNQELVTVTMSSHDPQVSLAIVKAVIDSYLDEIVYAETQAREHQVAELNKQLSAANAALKQKQESLAQMTKRAGNIDPQMVSFRLSDLQMSIREASSQRSKLRLDVKTAEADLVSHEARIKSVKESSLSPAAVEVALRSDPAAQNLKAVIKRCQDIIDDFEQKTPGQMYPSLLANKNRIKAAHAKLKTRTKELKEEMGRQGEALGAGSREEMEFLRGVKITAIAAMKQRIEELGQEIVSLNKEFGQIKLADGQDILRQAIAQDEKFVNGLTDVVRRKQVDLVAGSRVSKAQDAELQKKDMKKQVLATAVAPVVAFLAACMGLAWMDVRQRRIRSAGEVSRGLGIRVVGAVPSLPHLERHLISPNGEPDLEGHPALESIDAIRTLLLRDADAEATRVVMVTSATTGEGKTTVASHLASSLARAGRKTLLIDGDLRTPSAHQLFELPMQPGFSEVLLAEVELTDAVQPTTLDGLSFMAAGQWDREVLQALARDGLEGIFEKLREEFDFVVIDSHPVLPATDSLLIGQRADAVILSVLREVSQMPRVYAASQRLSTLGIRVLGAVVNGADPEEALAATASARMVAH